MSPLAAYASAAAPPRTPNAARVSFASAATPRLATAIQRAKAEKTAQAFEASFLSSMFGQMFQGTDLSAPFGGGEGEQAFRSFMTDAMGKSMAARGGIGLAKSVTTEMLKLQGLS